MPFPRTEFRAVRDDAGRRRQAEATALRARDLPPPAPSLSFRSAKAEGGEIGPFRPPPTRFAPLIDLPLPPSSFSPSARTREGDALDRTSARCRCYAAGFVCRTEDRVALVAARGEVLPEVEDFGSDSETLRVTVATPIGWRLVAWPVAVLMKR